MRNMKCKKCGYIVGTLTNNVYHTWINCVPDERDMNDESLEVEGYEVDGREAETCEGEDEERILECEETIKSYIGQ